MEAKLTLKLDQTVINSAKSYAENSHQSLSKLVEDFFRNLIYKDDRTEKYPSLIEKLSGVISERDLDRLSHEDEKARSILRKNK
ncbi:MAG: DUF6364 family protein [Treponema sp.]|jgi:hypothetical protein|nr:DUF6364 family protein [Treponema sp.]